MEARAGESVNVSRDQDLHWRYMSVYPRISIVTPSFNDAAYLERTILSLTSQNYPNLEYIIIDGGSTDGTLDIIKRYQDKISYWVSETDGGMYEAIGKGLERSTGEIMGWINSDDKHQPGSLFTIAQVFTDFMSINWIQGTPTVIGENDRIFTFPYEDEVDKLFFYQRKHASARKFIQQESTFWRRSLWEKAGGHISLEYRFAGDFELWVRFFQFEKLYYINAVLASFRLTRDFQASKDHFKEYLAETFRILESYPLSAREKRRIKYFNLLESLYRLIGKGYRKISRKVKVDTVVRDPMFFDATAQKLVKW